MLVLIDNYDSFSYNLYQQIAQFYPHIQVIRNDELSIAEIAKLNPKGLIISPGPKAPKDAGICIEAIKHFAPKIPILGVCLGHQAICEAFGGKVSYATKIMHGKSSIIKTKQDSPLFASLPHLLQVARYHSLAIMERTLPPCLEVIARVASNADFIESKNIKEPFVAERHLQKYIKDSKKTAKNHKKQSNNVAQKENTIMAISHKEYKTFGVQFHPESILTPLGSQIIKNFLAQIV